MKNNTLDRNSAEFLFEELSEIVADQSSSLQDKLLHCRLIFKDLLNKLTEHESQFFSGLYPKTIFIADKYALPFRIKRDMRKFRWLVAQVKKDPGRKCSEIELSFSIFTLSKLIENFSSVRIPESFSPLLYDYEIAEAEFSDYDRETTFFRKIQAVVIPKFIDVDNEDAETADDNLIYCETDELGAIKLVLNEKWAHLREMVQAGDRLNIINVNSKIVDKINNLSCKASTIIVLQPDFLIDVTDIAECFLSEGVNTNLHFLKKFVKSSTSAPMATGNIINTCFDELLYDPKIDFETAFNKAMSYKPLQMFALAYRDPGSIALIKAKAENQFN
ncbi:MAG: hypothetical protein PF588_03165, partial [Candidatus Kapabacteria bacterium]|nr:hypothetical protein [Candidatus Kapabacteria bacterium]